MGSKGFPVALALEIRTARPAAIAGRPATADRKHSDGEPNMVWGADSCRIPAEAWRSRFALDREALHAHGAAPRSGGRSSALVDRSSHARSFHLCPSDSISRPGCENRDSPRGLADPRWRANRLERTTVVSRLSSLEGNFVCFQAEYVFQIAPNQPRREPSFDGISPALAFTTGDVTLASSRAIGA
jgi:hypothetical protein